LEFIDVTYSVKQNRKEVKTIIHGLSGEFRSGELVAVLGPSGNNILIWYTIISLLYSSIMSFPGNIHFHLMEAHWRFQGGGVSQEPIFI